MAHTAGAALARKLSVGQGDLVDRPRSILRALRLGFARAAGERFNLPLAVIGAKQADRAQAGLATTLVEDWLLLKFTGSDGVVAACLDLNCVSAIVQTQTIGDVTPDAPAERGFTDTDAAMAAPLVEDALRRAVVLVDPEDQQGLMGFEYASRAVDLRGLTLSLVADSYRVFDLTVELGGGLRQGQITIVLPDPPAPDEAEIELDVDTGPRLEQSSGVVRAELNAVVCRMRLPLAHLSGLEVGSLLPLTGARLDRTEVLTIERTRASVGRLGQSGGMRAVRLNENVPLPALDALEPAEFIESRPASVRGDMADTDVDILSDPLDMVASSTGVDPLHDDLSLVEPDRMVAEISQLAGLVGPKDGEV